MLKNKKAQAVSVIALALAALASGTSFAVVKDTLNSIKPFTLMAVRFFCATVLMLIIFARRFKNIRRRDIYNNFFVGIFLFLALLTLVTGVSYTTASKQAFLVGAYVLAVPFLSWAFNKKRPDMYSILGVVMATFGIGLLTLNNSMDINRGDILSVLCALFFACHMVAIEYFNKDSDPIISATVQFAVVSLLFIILAAVFEPYRPDFSPELTGAMAYLVVVTTVFSFAVQNIGQKYISSTSTALIFTLETAFGGVFAVYLLNEKMTLQMKIGCLIIFSAIVIGESKLQFLKRNKAGTALPSEENL